MVGRLCDRRRRLTALGVMLCLLAALFAIEAKLAWFSPAGSPSAQVSAAKLQLADAPRHVSQALAAPDPQHFSAEVPVLLLFALLLTAAPVLLSPQDSRARVSASPGFYSPLFRRPPPQK